MYTILIKILSMFFPMVLAYVLKRRGFFGPTDYRLLARIAINITLPCTVVASFGSQTLDRSMLGVTVFAFAANLLIAGYSLLVTSRFQDVKTRCMTMFCIQGFNMGNFLIPFAQQFMGATGVAVTALFDAGNSPMCTSGHYTFTTTVVKVDSSRPTVKSVVKKLFSSPPFDVYMLMILFLILGVRIPDPVTQICQLTGNANAFCSMFMMGLMFEIRFESRYLKLAAYTLGCKYAFGLAMALVSYFLLPFDPVVRQVMVLIAFAPVPNLASIFTDQVEGDVGLCSFITSCSFIISSCVITALVFLMNVQ